MRYRRIDGFVRLFSSLAFSVLLAACNGGSGSSPQGSQELRNANPLTLSGSIGDGPVTGAAVTVLDANGESVVAGVSDGAAGYRITVPAGTAFPITVTASGGTDLVTGLPPDFDFKSVLFDPTISRVNVSPFSALALAITQCGGNVNSQTVADAWATLEAHMSMGMDGARVPDPAHGAIDGTNVADIVLANEALGEALRRTQAALAGTSAAADVATLVERLGCDLGDGVIDGVPGAADARTAATFSAASIGVLLEVIAGKLQVNGADAMAPMDASIRTIMPDADPAATTLDVPVSQALVDQAKAALAVAMSTMGDDALLDYAVLLDSTDPADARATLNGALTTADSVTFDGLAARVAASDDTEISTFAVAQQKQPSTGAPIVSLAASPASVDAGATTLLSWSSTDAQRCKASGDWNGREPTQGTKTVGPLQASKNYKLSCVGLGGTATAATSVEVAMSAPPAMPVTTLTADPTSIASGGSSTLTWSATDASSCTASGGWTGARAISGTESIGPLNANTSFSLACTGAGGTSSATATVLVQQAAAAPTLTLAASPTSVLSGDTSTLSWSSTNTTSCSASGGWSGTKATSGSASVGPLMTGQTFSLTCNGAGGSVTRSATIAITTPGAPTLTFTASPTSVAGGSSSTLTWSTTNATSCTAGGSWSGSKGTSGSQSTGALSANANYSLTCTGAGGSVTQSAAVTVMPAPTLTFAASPTSVQSGAASQLTWTATNATSCTASGAWSGSKSTSGTQSSGALTSNKTYTLTCTGAGGSIAKTASVTVLPAPTLTLAASPTSVASGAATQLSWSTTNATSCTASGGWSGTKATSGTQSSGALSANTTFTLTCTGSGGSVSRSAAATIVAAPTLTLSASPTSVSSGGSSTLTWSSTNASSCAASGSWSGTKSTSGSQSTGALSGSATYTLACTGSGGTATRTVSVTQVAAAPTVALSASPASIASGASSTLSWSSTNATSCTASGAWTGSKATSGSQSTGALTANKSYTMTCTGAGGSASKTASVTVTTAPPSATLSANPPGVPRNGSTTLSWSSTNATGCTASGAWSGSLATSGSQSVGPIAQDSTYSITCSGGGGNAVAMTTVMLREARLSWTAPTKNTDGSNLTNLSGYKIYYGTSSKNYSQTVSVPGGTTSTWTLQLAPGTYYFALTAIDSAGGESAKTNEVSKSVN